MTTKQVNLNPKRQRKQKQRVTNLPGKRWEIGTNCNYATYTSICNYATYTSMYGGWRGTPIITEPIRYHDVRPKPSDGAATYKPGEIIEIPLPPKPPNKLKIAAKTALTWILDRLPFTEEDK